MCNIMSELDTQSPGGEPGATCENKIININLLNALL